MGCVELVGQCVSVCVVLRTEWGHVIHHVVVRWTQQAKPQPTTSDQPRACSNEAWLLCTHSITLQTLGRMQSV